MAASASPAWMASASRSIPPPKRWTVRSTTMPSPTGTSAGGARALDGRARRLLDRGPHRRAHARAVRGRADDVAEHRAGLDRRELARVADEDQPRLAADGLGEAGHQRERDHRGLVDDHDVVRESIAAVVAEAAVGAGLPAEQAVERRGLELEQPRADRGVDVQPRRLGVDRFGEPRGGLAGRRGERDERGCGARGERLLLQQRDDPGDGRRLAGARASGDDRQASQHRGGGGLLLPVVGRLAPEQPGEAVGEHVHPHRVVGGAGQRLEVGRDLLLLAPVAVEVERAALEPQRAVRADELARRDLRDPCGGRRPRQGGEVDGVVDVDRRRLADPLEVDEDVPDARRAHGEGGGQQNGIVRSADQAGEAARHVDVGGGEHARVVELEQQPGRAPREAGVEALGEVAHAASPRSRTSLSASTSAARRLPGEHAARRAVDHRRVRPRHPAHEQVQDAGEVALRGVARHPPAQVAMQRDEVEQRLQPVVGVGHLGGERGRAVMPGGQLLAGRREPVRLVVDDREALAVEPHHEVDAAREVAAHARAQPRVEQALRVAGQRIARLGVLAQHPRDRRERQRRAARVVAAHQRELEVQLVESVRAHHIP